MTSALKVRINQNWRMQLLVLIERHALIVFFMLAYGISWTVWTVEPLVAAFDPVVGKWFGLLAPYGPTFAACAVAALLHPEPVPRDRSTRHVVFTAAALIGTLAVLWRGLGAIGRSPHVLITAGMWLLIVIMPVWVVWNVRSRVAGVRALLGSLAAWRVHIGWYGAALLLMPLLSVLGIMLLALLGKQISAVIRTEPLPELLPLLLTVFIATLLYGGPLGEEAGWRGFALPKLQARFSPVVASVVLGVLWGLWHLPLHLNGFYQGSFPDGVAGIGLRLLSSVGLAILFTWLYNRTQGNLLLMVLLHTAVNNTAGFWLPITLGMYIMMAVLVVIVIRLDKMWLRVPAASTLPDVS